MYQRLYKHGIARVDAETAHHLALRGLARASTLPGGLSALTRSLPEPDERLRLRVWDLPFANPLGVAAGLDKDGAAVEALIALGFGHVEVGTITLRPQPGNDRPRIWRVPEEHAVINAMGFPSSGAAAVRAHLIGLRAKGVVGINIGKNRDTPLEAAAEDYAGLVATLFPIANYFTINISSPNTPGLRSLQMADELAHLLATVRDANQHAADLARRDPKPLLVKIAPDLTDAEIEGVAEAAVANGARGIVATNTTTSRSGLPPTYADLPGGLSGPPLREQADHVVRVLYRRVGNQVPIIGVGGISSGADAVARIRSGATLVQLYTAFTWAGPSLPAQILRDLSADADRTGWRSILDIVGIDGG
ncbi:MAG TPA: quinone-dependent dihydroorotate dehydrogenase [Thermomicrobiales bacterium]|nr:quinone-dependent dihydroorotate dehydrogenase [Thermomicrobiales bacterium]